MAVPKSIGMNVLFATWNGDTPANPEMATMAPVIGEEARPKPRIT